MDKISIKKDFCVKSGKDFIYNLNVNIVGYSNREFVYNQLREKEKSLDDENFNFYYVDNINITNISYCINKIKLVEGRIDKKVKFANLNKRQKEDGIKKIKRFIKKYDNWEKYYETR